VSIEVRAGRCHRLQIWGRRALEHQVRRGPPIRPQWEPRHKPPWPVRRFRIYWIYRTSLWTSVVRQVLNDQARIRIRLPTRIFPQSRHYRRETAYRLKSRSKKLLTKADADSALSSSAPNLKTSYPASFSSRSAIASAAYRAGSACPSGCA
jgi:hypothetical protein